MSDQVLKSEIHIDDLSGVVTHRITQPTEDLILDRNKELRKNPGAIQDLGKQGTEGTWGRQVATIPENLLIWASRNGYDIYNKDQQIASKELFRFLQSDKGKPCLVVDKLKR